MLEGLIIAAVFVFIAGFCAGAGWYYYLAHRLPYRNNHKWEV